MELIVDIIIVLIYIMLAGAVGSACWSIFHGWRNRSRTLPEERLSYRTSVSVALLTVAVMLISLLFSSSEPMRIAGRIYTGSLWLTIADVCMMSIALLLVAFVVLAVAIPLIGRRDKGMSIRNK